jgi:hypothetical protein
MLNLLVISVERMAPLDFIVGIYDGQRVSFSLMAYNPHRQRSLNFSFMLPH